MSPVEPGHSWLTPRRFVAALVLGLVVRLATLPLPGHDDVITWKIWSYAASRHVTRMYGVGGSPPIRGIVTWGDLWTTVDYPPFFLYEYAIVALNIIYIYGAGLGRGWAVPRMMTGIDLSVLVAFVNVGVLFWFARRLRDEARADRQASAATRPLGAGGS